MKFQWDFTICNGNTVSDSPALWMPKDSVTPSKHYKGVAIGFFLHIVFSIFYIFTYNFRKHSSAYAKDNTLLLFLLIPAHLEVPLSMLITKEVPRARFPGG